MRPALVDQVVTDVPGVGIGAGASIARRRLRQLNHLAGHPSLRQSALFGDLFYGMAVAVASGKFHSAVSAGWILPQGLLDDTLTLDELTPFQCAEQSQAADAVADGDLIGGLLLVLGLHQLGDGQAHFGEALLDPGQRQGQRGAVAL